jgi:serine/threonine protein kinase
VSVSGVRKKGATHTVVLLHELCEGGSIADFATSLASASDVGGHTAEPLPEIAIAAVLRQILLGLVHAHGKGVVHRDIKGANILLTADGEARVRDDLFAYSNLCTPHACLHSSLHHCWLTVAFSEYSIFVTAE